jgi:hypothetical protein
MTSPKESMLSCEQFNDRLTDLLERDVSEKTRAEMEAHALSCAECGALLADLRALRIDAANLEVLTPSRDLWAGIAARIETPVVSIGGASGAAHRPSAIARRTRLRNGLAAAALVAITATITYELTRRSIGQPSDTVATVSVPIATLSSPPTTVAATADSAQQSNVSATVPATSAPSGTKAGAIAPATTSLAANSTRAKKASAAETYDREITRLRTIVDQRRGTLDSTTVAVLEKNLRIIDDAILQCRRALESDPSSTYLNDSLNEALDNKVQLLRAAATLQTTL